MKMCIRDSLGHDVGIGNGQVTIADGKFMVPELFLGQNGYVSVSYTHLDVYKRQQLHSCSFLMVYNLFCNKNIKRGIQWQISKSILHKPCGLRLSLIHI